MRPSTRLRPSGSDSASNRCGITKRRDDPAVVAGFGRGKSGEIPALCRNGESPNARFVTLILAHEHGLRDTSVSPLLSFLVSE